MAIDSSLFAADIPTGSYTKGDTIQLKCIAGPAVVRSGRGAALLKRTTVGLLTNASGTETNWKISIKNSDWIDPMISLTASIRDATALDERSGTVQRGNDCPLTPNSSWTVIATATRTVTTTHDNSMFALIDVDYPSVSSITDPDALAGIPASIDYEVPSTITINAPGTIAAARWDSFNVDVFKAGYEYALQKIEISTPSVGCQGFIGLSNAAGMGGLQRIMPIANTPFNIRNKVEYSTRLQKGPMDINFLMFNSGTSATTETPDVLMDFVKRRIQ